MSLTLDRALYVLPVGRQDFGSVNPEIQITEGQIIEVLLYFHHIFNKVTRFYVRFLCFRWFSECRFDDRTTSKFTKWKIIPNIKPKIVNNFIVLTAVY